MRIFYVQGGGLGHLTRIDRLIRSLKIPSDKVLIITPSAFTHYFKGYSFRALSWKAPVENWTQTISSILRSHEVTAFYIDAFPLGLKGELIPIFKSFKRAKYIYIARILKWETYLNAMPETHQPKFDKTFVIEHLYASHYKWLSQHSLQLIKLNIYADFSSVEASKSPQKPYSLVVHSGGVNALLKLCNSAKNDSETDPCKLLVFSQVHLDLDDPLIEIRTGIYPVSNYFKHAVKIYTAGGFNSMHELRPYAKKHMAVAFDKLYDDQFYRLDNFKNNRHI